MDRCVLDDVAISWIFFLGKGDTAFGGNVECFNSHSVDFVDMTPFQEFFSHFSSALSTSRWAADADINFFLSRISFDILETIRSIADNPNTDLLGGIVPPSVAPLLRPLSSLFSSSLSWDDVGERYDRLLRLMKRWAAMVHDGYGAQATRELGKSADVISQVKEHVPANLQVAVRADAIPEPFRFSSLFFLSLRPFSCWLSRELLNYTFRRKWFYHESWSEEVGGKYVYGRLAKGAFAFELDKAVKVPIRIFHTIAYSLFADSTIPFPKCFHICPGLRSVPPSRERKVRK